jgi:glucokinase
MKVLGIDIGGTNTEVGVVDSELGILEVVVFNTKDATSFEDYITTLTKKVQLLSSKYELYAIGIGAPNYDSVSGEFRPVNFPWKDLHPFNLKLHLESKVGISTSVVNDANAAALAENRYGVGQENPTFIMVTIGTGLGGAIVINNRLLEGASGYAGEFGHIKIENISRKCNCGGIGCLETVVSANGIKGTYASNIKNITGSFPDKIPTVKTIFDRARNNDDVCQQTLKFTFETLGNKLADFIHIINPEAVVFCGNISKSLGAYMPIMQDMCENQLLPDFRGKMKYVVSDLLEKRMNILGPASLAFSIKETVS